MSLLSRIADVLRGTTRPTRDVRPRRERRDEGRERHHSSGEPAWTSADRHVGEPGRREVQDVAAGTPGEFGSHRVIED
jgi:hypothetical protein